jgi:putative ABC transport system ATP-binding protein
VIGEEEVVALKSIDISIDSNEYIAIVGTSGSGKSTLMNILGCLDRPSSGTYMLAGEDVSSLSSNRLAKIRNQRIGFIFQSFCLMPRMTALENVEQPLIYRNLSKAERRLRAETSLERVGLGNRMKHLPNELSGGQRQRVAIARALVTSPSILLADEPTGNLDAETAVQILQLFQGLHHEGQTVILVTHDSDVARNCLRKVSLVSGEIAADLRSP